jgi:hypothetical protein
MVDELFNDLLESVRQGGAIFRGEKNLREILAWKNPM